MSCKSKQNIKGMNDRWNNAVGKNGIRSYDRYTRLRDNDKTNMTHLIRPNGKVKNEINQLRQRVLHNAGMDDAGRDAFLKTMKSEAELIEKLSDGALQSINTVSHKSAMAVQDLVKDGSLPNVMVALAEMSQGRLPLLSDASPTDRLGTKNNLIEKGVGFNNPNNKTGRNIINHIFNSGSRVTDRFKGLDMPTGKELTASLKPFVSRIREKDKTISAADAKVKALKQLEGTVKANQRLNQDFIAASQLNENFKDTLEASNDAGIFDPKGVDLYSIREDKELASAIMQKIEIGFNNDVNAGINTVKALDSFFRNLYDSKNPEGLKVSKNIVDRYNEKLKNAANNLIHVSDTIQYETLKNAINEQVDPKLKKKIDSGKLGTMISHEQHEGKGAIGQTFSKQPMEFNWDYFNKDRKRKDIMTNLNNLMDARSDYINKNQLPSSKFSAGEPHTDPKSSKAYKALLDSIDAARMDSQRGKSLDIGSKVETKVYADSLIELHSMADKDIFFNVETDPRGSRLKVSGTSWLSPGMHALIIPKQTDKVIKAKNSVYELSQAERDSWAEEASHDHKAKDWYESDMIELDQTTSGLTLTTALMGHKEMFTRTKINGHGVDGYQYAGLQILEQHFPEQYKKYQKTKSEKKRKQIEKGMRKLVKGAKGNATIYGIANGNMVGSLKTFMAENGQLLSDIGIDADSVNPTAIAKTIIDGLNPSFEINGDKMKFVDILKHIQETLGRVEMGNGVYSEPKNKYDTFDTFNVNIHKVDKGLAGAAASLAHGIDGSIMNRVGKILIDEGVPIQPRHDALIAKHDHMGRVREVELETIEATLKDVRVTIIAQLKDKDPEFLDGLKKAGFFTEEFEALNSIQVFDAL